MRKPVPAPCDNRRAAAGRPTKATPELVTRLAEAIATGLTDEQAADLAGIHVETLRRWRTGDGEFCGAVKRATALRLVSRLQRIEAGAPGWQGTAWVLERNDRARWGPPTVRQEHAGKDGGPLLGHVAALEAALRKAYGA